MIGIYDNNRHVNEDVSIYIYRECVLYYNIYIMGKYWLVPENSGKAAFNPFVNESLLSFRMANHFISFSDPHLHTQLEKSCVTSRSTEVFTSTSLGPRL